MISKSSRRLLKIIIAVGLVFMLFLAAKLPTQAQPSTGWPEPIRLSRETAVTNSEAFMVSDQFGYVHLFWSEIDEADLRSSIQYVRYDGQSWSEIIDIHLTAPNLVINTISPVVDKNGILRLVWTEGNSGPVYYSSAPAADALSAHNWDDPIEVGIPAFQVGFQVDSQQVFHIVYSNFYGVEPGMYYVKSIDLGRTWSSPLWLNPEIPVGDVPNIMQFKLDASDGLHVLWYNISLIAAETLGQAIQYIHSLDGGDTWSIPIDIDVADDTIDELRIAYPIFAVVGESVHVLWAGNSNVNREYRYSFDRGVSWSETNRVFGHLHGMALGDGLASDATGALHFFGQIRWPQGIYHAVWENGSWLEPSMVYLIARSSDEGLNGRYHAHAVRAAVQGGNQLVLTFRDDIDGPLFVMTRRLDGVASSFVKPADSSPAAPTEEAVVATATPTADTTTSFPQFDTELTTASRSPDSLIRRTFWLSLLPVLLLLISFIFYRYFRQRV